MLIEYTATLFDTANQWYYEVSCHAYTLEEARKYFIANYQDKRVKVKQVVRA